MDQLEARPTVDDGSGSLSNSPPPDHTDDKNKSDISVSVDDNTATSHLEKGLSTRQNSCVSKDEDNLEDMFEGALEEVHEDKALVEDREIDNAAKFELQNDIFSMFFLAPYGSASFFYSMMVFAVQITILILALVNKLEKSDDDEGTFLSIFKIPARNDPEVIASQFFAIIIAVFVSTDVVDSLEVFLIKYDETILHDYPDATRTKWILSYALRFIEGILGIAVAMVFIVQATDVLDLFLDFTAVLFVSDLDNVAYYIANKGYIVAESVQSLTESMLDVTMCQNERFDDIMGEMTRKKQRRRMLYKRTVFYVILLILLVMMMFVVFYLQDMGIIYTSKCENFQINLPPEEYAFFEKCIKNKSDYEWMQCSDSWKAKGEQGSPINFSQFSGVYKMKTKVNSGGVDISYDRRPHYEQVSPSGGFYPDNRDKPSGIFRYCKNENAWVFTIEGVSKGANANDCSWLLKSPETEADTMDDLPEEDWKVWTGAIDESAVDITCLDCVDTKSNGAPDQAKDSGCNFRGECGEGDDLGTCLCDSGFTGLTCSRCSDCLMQDLEYDNEPQRTFKRLDRSENKPMLVNDRQVHVSNNETGTSKNWVSDKPLLSFFYWNDRYVLWDLEDIVNKTDNGDYSLDSILDFFNLFHAAWEETEPFLVREVSMDRWETQEKAGLLWTDYDSFKTQSRVFTAANSFKLTSKCHEDRTCPF